MLERNEEALETGVAVAETAAVDGLESVDRASWDTLQAPLQGPLRSGYLGAWEHAKLDGLRLRPLVALDEDAQVVAAVPGYFYDLDLAQIHSHVAAGALAAVRRLLPRFLMTHVYEVGTPTALVQPFLHEGGLPRRTAARALLEAALREAEAGDAQMVIAQNFPSPDDGTSAVFRELGFSSVPIPPTVVVDLPFDSFDEYLAAMRAQYRRRARKVFRGSEHLSVDHVLDFHELAPELARLWRLVYERADEVKREILGLEYFRATARLDDLSVLALRRPDGSIASYALLLDDRPWLHFLYCGFEEQAGKEESAYFRLIYEIVRHGIEAGYTSVNLGITTLEPKLDAGGIPVALKGWLRHRHPLLQKTFAALGSGPFAPAPARPRHVFKDGLVRGRPRRRP